MKKLETPIKTLEDLMKLEPGDVVLVSSIINNDLMVLLAKIPSLKYPLKSGDSKGRKHRNKRIRGILTPIFADENGHTGNEMINKFEFMGQGSSLTLDEDDTDKEIAQWKIRLLDKKHPKYNPIMAENAKKINVFLSGLKFE